MAKKLHVDIETFSSVDIMTSGHYKYIQSIDFEILLVAYSIDDGPIEIIDLAQGEKLPSEFTKALLDPEVENRAHNATFERNAFNAFGLYTDASQWHCSAIKAGYCGWPLSLEMVSKAMKLESNGKLATGKVLIKYFCCPVKPTKVNGMRERNFYYHDLEKWEEFKLYCIGDVRAEKTIEKRLEKYKIPEFERLNYLLDQKINDRGILIDLSMAANAIKIDNQFTKELTNRVKDLTGIDNPKSPLQMKNWLGDVMQKEITTLAKDAMKDLIKEAGSGPAGEVLKLRNRLSKTSTKKYSAMLNCACEDNRAHGLLQFYGANRTGRWAGRLIQVQNLPQNHISDLELAREVVASGDYEIATMMYDDLSTLLSQLIRTAFIAKPGHTFGIADFSAIEARVTAWLADEKWRLDVFATHGKIYEASAAMMFGLPIESIKKGSPERDKGKVAELALGYQGALGALKKMGGEAMGLSEPEMEAIVKKWRLANPNIVSLWKNVENCAIQAIKTQKIITSKFKNLEFACNGEVLTIKLPSGRKLFYQQPSFTTNKWGQASIQYKGMDQVTKQWIYIDTYGGKLIENIVQAIARDLLAQTMLWLDAEGFDIVMHVHDEAVCEIPDTLDKEDKLKQMNTIMGLPIPWAKGLRLTAEGYITNFYKKD